MASDVENRVLLENYLLPRNLERLIERFFEHCKYERYHEALSNITAADDYIGGAQVIMH